MELKRLYPFKSRWLDIDGKRLHYIDEGPKDSRTIILVHGNPTWSFYFRNLIPPLSRNFRVVACDHMGCGLSDRPDSFPYTIESHIQNLDLLVKSLKIEECVWALHDWGGAIGMGCACRNQDMTKAFVIFNTAAFLMEKIPLRIRICRSSFLGAFIVRRLNLFLRLGLYMGTSKPERFDRKVKSGYLFPYGNYKDRVAIHRFVQEIPVERDHPNRRLVKDIDACMSVFKDHPVRIFWGEDDFCFTVKDVLPEWEKRFPNATVSLIKEAGHFVVEDAWEKILPDMIRFIEAL